MSDDAGCTLLREAQALTIEAQHALERALAHASDNKLRHASAHLASASSIIAFHLFAQTSPHDGLERILKQEPLDAATQRNVPCDQDR